MCFPLKRRGKAKLIGLGNLNQIAKRANETRNIYESDIKDIQDNYEKLWGSAESIMKKLAMM